MPPSLRRAEQNARTSPWRRSQRLTADLRTGPRWPEPRPLPWITRTQRLPCSDRLGEERGERQARLVLRHAVQVDLVAHGVQALPEPAQDAIRARPRGGSGVLRRTPRRGRPGRGAAIRRARAPRRRGATRRARRRRARGGNGFSFAWRSGLTSRIAARNSSRSSSLMAGFLVGARWQRSLQYSAARSRDTRPGPETGLEDPACQRRRLPCRRAALPAGSARGRRAAHRRRAGPQLQRRQPFADARRAAARAARGRKHLVRDQRHADRLRAPRDHGAVRLRVRHGGVGRQRRRQPRRRRAVFRHRGRRHRGALPRPADGRGVARRRRPAPARTSRPPRASRASWSSGCSRSPCIAR